ncbi:MAG: SH3 domain-containing protein, partial [Chlamydiae bacterium]|nr:SH3 domain-containing protein [Chlamydiota bacterium]
NLEGHVVCETTAGQLFGIIGEENDYFAVQPPRGTKGFVFRTFVLENVIEGERVNVRLYPDIEAPVVARLNTGDRVSAHVSDINSKWLEIDLPDSSHFYIAKEYIEKKGDLALVKEHEMRHHEASHLLRATFLFAQSEIQKSFPQIEIIHLNGKFDEICSKYEDLNDIVAHATEAKELMQELYTQKKIAFLESKASNSTSTVTFKQDHLERLEVLGISVQAVHEENALADLGAGTANAMGIAATLNDEQITDKMQVWKPVEETLFHLWAAANDADSIEEFYSAEDLHAIYISGMIEPYNRPVKNLPGDFMLKSESQPVAFLYSTRVDLSKMVGRNVTVRVAPRPNNHFAFPAYYVLSVE